MKLFIRRLSLIVLLSGVFNVIIAQDVQVKSVKLMSNDNSAVSKPRKDLNDTNCALVKLEYDDDISRVEGNVIGDIVAQGKEKWVYLTAGSKEMKVIPANQVPFTISFNRYGIRSVGSGKTYKVVVEIHGNEVVTEKKGYPSKDVETFTVDGITFKMVRVKGGEFTMGATPEQLKYAEDREKPAHQVVLSDYYIGETEVTQELWEKLMGNNPSYTKGAKLPVDKVDKEMCRTFLRVLESKLELPFRFPTEAEWEYAARGGSKSRKTTFSGSNNLNEVGWFTGNSGGQAHPVAKKKPNELGIYDMSGNVWEHTQDFATKYPSMKLYDPLPQRLENNYIVRGGSWAESMNKACNCYRATVRMHDDIAGLGLRIALDGFDAKDKEKQLDQLVNTPAKCVETKTANGIQFDIDGVKFRMIKVDGGTFKMGATKEQKKANKNEKPVHPVTLTDYYIAETEVTEELWQTIIHDSRFEFFGYQLPVARITLNQIQKFLQRLTNITGWQFRLPTEAEWEFAARGGNKSKGYMFSGGNDCDEIEWYGGNARSVLQEVAQKKPNELGIYDMSGNVREFCSDYYGPYEQSKEPVVNPTGPSKGDGFVTRGGSSYEHFLSSRVSERQSYDISAYNYSDIVGNNLGFRMVMDVK